MTDSKPGEPPEVIRRLGRVSPTVAFVATLVVVLAGLFAPGIIGGAVLLALAAGLIFLTMTTWPVQPPATRTLRLLVLTMLFTAALYKII